MKLLTLSLLLLALTGCCTACFKKDVSKMFIQEKNLVPKFHKEILGLFKSKKRDSSAFQDFMGEIRKERVDTANIRKDLSDIFYSSP